MRQVIEAFRDAYARKGEDLQLGENLSFGFHFYLSDSKEKAVRESARFFEENLKMFGPLRLVRALTDDQIDAMSDPKRAPTSDLPRIEGAVDAGGFLCGTPEQVAAQLKRIEELYPGLDRVSVSQPVGTPQAIITEQLEWFAKEVMPAFKPAQQPARVAD